MHRHTKSLISLRLPCNDTLDLLLELLQCQQVFLAVGPTLQSGATLHVVRDGLPLASQFLEDSHEAHVLALGPEVGLRCCFLLLAHLFRVIMLRWALLKLLILAQSHKQRGPTVLIDPGSDLIQAEKAAVALGSLCVNKLGLQFTDFGWIPQIFNSYNVPGPLPLQASEMLPATISDLALQAENDADLLGHNFC